MRHSPCCHAQAASKTWPASPLLVPDQQFTFMTDHLHHAVTCMQLQRHGPADWLLVPDGGRGVSEARAYHMTLLSARGQSRFQGAHGYLVQDAYFILSAAIFFWNSADCHSKAASGGAVSLESGGAAISTVVQHEEAVLPRYLCHTAVQPQVVVLPHFSTV
eukprot:scaffold212913_cov23-Tisochrysis_lutea.AAC.1